MSARSSEAMKHSSSAAKLQLVHGIKLPASSITGNDLFVSTVRVSNSEDHPSYSHSHMLLHAVVSDSVAVKFAHSRCCSRLPSPPLPVPNECRRSDAQP